jgi:heptosyltransferase-2
MVMAQSLLITLKKLYPSCLIDVVVPQWSLPVLERMPQVNRGIGLPVLHGEFSLLTRIKMGLSLRGNRYTHAIVLPRSWKSALVPYFAGARVRTGYRGEMRYGLLNDMRKLDKQILRQTVQRYVAHAYEFNSASELEIPFPQLEVDEANRERLLSSLNLSIDKPVICMMPGAEYGPAKQWPVEYYADLSGKLVDSGYLVWVLGSNKEKILGKKIVGNKSGVFNLCGETDLIDVIDLLSCAEQVVSNDSGLMHVAAAVSTKLNVIYGSSTPDYTPPLASEKRLNIFYLALECSPCFKRECPLGHTNCLNNIQVETLYQKIKARS